METFLIIKTSLLVLTKGQNLPEQKQRFWAHIHTRQCQDEMVMICFNGHATRPLLPKTSDSAVCDPWQKLSGKNTTRMT
jgi:hypothetical protein